MTGHTAVFKNEGINQRVPEVIIPFSDGELLRFSFSRFFTEHLILVLQQIGHVTVNATLLPSDDRAR